MLSRPLARLRRFGRVRYPSPVEIALVKDDDLSIVTLKGRGEYQDREKLRDYLDLLQKNEGLLLIVDLTKAEFVPASLLGILTNKGEEFVNAGGRVMFVVAEDSDFSPLVDVAHLQRFFATAPTVDEASRRIRVEDVEEKSVKALIRRAKPTPPPLPDVETPESSETHEADEAPRRPPDA